MKSISLSIVVAFSVFYPWDKSGQWNANANDAYLLIQRVSSSSSFRDQLKFTVSLDERERGIGKTAHATLLFENSCDQDIKMRGPGTILLYRRFSKKARDSFMSSSALPGTTKTTTTATVTHTVRRTWIICPKGGQLEFKIDLAALKWNRQIGAEGPNQDFAQVVPPGNYEMFFVFTVGESMNVEIPEGTMFWSNKVTITIK